MKASCWFNADDVEEAERHVGETEHRITSQDKPHRGSELEL